MFPLGDEIIRCVKCSGSKLSGSSFPLVPTKKEKRQEGPKPGSKSGARRWRLGSKTKLRLC